MEALEIPTSSDAFYTQTSRIEGTDYLLAFKYNQREDRWYLSISEANGTEITKGLKIVVDWPLTISHPDERLPPGRFVVLSSTTDKSPPGFTDFGGSDKRCKLYYLTSE